MQLKQLTIKADENEIRRIVFNDNINIITSKDNDVGKSTALQAINFCLGADKKSFWEHENGENRNIKQYLTSGHLFFYLDIVIGSKAITIKRRLYIHETKKSQQVKVDSWINEVKYSTDDKFKHGLQNELCISNQKISYSILKNKFIRINPNAATNALKFNSPYKADYKALYSFLFDHQNMNLINIVQQLSDEIQKKEQRIKALLNKKTPEFYQQKLNECQSKIKVIEASEKKFETESAQLEGLDELNATRSEIVDVSAQITRLKDKLKSNENTIKQYQNKIHQADATILNDIYEEACSLQVQVSKKYFELETFHNQVLQQKIKFITENQGRYRAELNEKNRTLTQLLEKEKLFITEASNKHSFAGLITLNNRKSEHARELGQNEQILKEIQIEKADILRLTFEKEDREAEERLFHKELINNMETFNERLKKYSTYVLNNTELSLKYDEDPSHKNHFAIENLEKCTGKGVPRAASFVFDMVMAKHNQDKNSRLFQFTIQDHIDDIDMGKFIKITQLCKQHHIQVVCSILDKTLEEAETKFHDHAFLSSIEPNIQLRLSQENQFFKFK